MIALDYEGAAALDSAIALTEQQLVVLAQMRAEPDPTEKRGLFKLYLELDKLVSRCEARWWRARVESRFAPMLRRGEAGVGSGQGRENTGVRSRPVPAPRRDVEDLDLDDWKPAEPML